MASPDIRSAFDLAEAFHLAQAVATLHELGILDELAHHPSTAGAIATRHRLDGALLEGVLEYVAARTDIVRKKGQTFAATRHYEGGARFVLNLYLGAFGQNAIRLRDVLRNPRLGATVVDRARHAQTFERAAGTAARPIASLIRGLQLTHVLDVGCGSGELLLQLGAADPNFVGWGIEMNPILCRAVRARVRRARLTRRIHVIEGDFRRWTPCFRGPFGAR